MSAVKVFFKRSSVPGKRPTSSNLEVGEIGLNTNSNDPGLFFEINDSTVVKVGPTSVGPQAPISEPSKGESWYNTADGTLNVGYENEWKSIAAPFLGGGGTIAFVAPEFPGATDSTLNDGQALPFQTLTRAILELSKKTINAILSGSSPASENSKYTIFLVSSRITANNGPGKSLASFTTNFSTSETDQVTIAQLEQFNSPNGGIIVPRGISIIGLDLKKCTVSPTYVPRYIHPAYSQNLGDLPEQPISSIFKWTGNTYLNNFSFLDKIETREVSQITADSAGNAVFRSKRPHGLALNEIVTVSFSPTVSQTTGTFKDGAYYAEPLDTFTFQLKTDPEEIFIQFSELPVLVGTQKVILYVNNELRSSHRLRGTLNATFDELADYYTKVQRAFPDYFGGQVTDGASLVSQAEYVIVAPTDFPYPDNLPANSTQNSSAYANSVNLRSDYGMCWGEILGDQLEGFRSLVANECTCVSLQKDPAAYEIYTTILNPQTNISEQKWWTLAEATYLSLPLSKRPGSIRDVSREEQLKLLNQTRIKNIRYYYQNQVTEDNKSIGIVNTNEDFRHFGFRARDGAYAQLQSIYTIGCAVGAWALNGGYISLTNSTTNFGSVSMKAEGFLGINTVSGAQDNQTGFLFEGIQRPLALSRLDVSANQNKQILSLGSRVLSINPDPLYEDIQLVELSSTFSPSFILPYSLAPGSAVWVVNSVTGVQTRGFLATDGGPTVFPFPGSCGLTSCLRIRASDSTLPNGPGTDLEIPYIRRFVDPREEFDRAYSFKVSNTYPNVIPPQVGSVLRLNQTNQAINPGTLRPNVQFDPGILGGWGRIFTVDHVFTSNLAESPQFNYVIGDSNESVNYYFTATVTDYSRPWSQGIDNSTGTYVTFQERNWYAAENNIWKTLYYGDANNFKASAGPIKLAPIEPNSPFVDSSVLERQDLIASTYQGFYAPDPYSEGDFYNSGDTYFRGSTYPYPSYSIQSYYDFDNGSQSLGFCLSLVETSSTTTVQASPAFSEIQSELMPDAQRRYRPAVVQFGVANPAIIPDPTEEVSIVALSADSDYEFFQVTGISGSVVTAIRLNRTNSYYPNPTVENKTWAAGAAVIVLEEIPYPNPESYDPVWSNTKQAVLRFFEIMGYTYAEVGGLLQPQYWGERLLDITNLAITPANGYALITQKWPLEFNSPSTIISNTHTWAFSGYLDYSRGLPKYQNNDISRKLSADFQSTVLWGGRITLTGVNNKGEIVLFGPQRQALTGRFYTEENPLVNPVNQELG